MAHVQAVPIRFRDIDALDHVNHAVMLTYAETVRCDWFQQLGHASMASLPFIVASAHIEYKAPIAKADPLEVAMWTSRVGGKSWAFAYHLRRRTDRFLFATVETVQVAYDYKAKATVEIPSALRAQLLALVPEAPAGDTTLN
ncbi:MAG TPA: thioesterase family protein [Candidatus Thermoplasmatota archaeon]|nr:thioesterase family protein [Candidatus Thermoplasmatota archaeon]